MLCCGVFRWLSLILCHVVILYYFVFFCIFKRYFIQFCDIMYYLVLLYVVLCVFNCYKLFYVILWCDMLCLFIVLYTALFRVVWCHFVILCIGVCVVIYSILYYIILFWYTLFTSFCDVLLYVPSVFIDTRSIVSFCYVFNYVAFVLCYLLFRFILYRNVLFCAFFFLFDKVYYVVLLYVVF